MTQSGTDVEFYNTTFLSNQVDHASVLLVNYARGVNVTNCTFQDNAIVG